MQHDWLTYIAIFFLSVAIIVGFFDFIAWLNIPANVYYSNEQVTSRSDHYELKVSDIQFCKEVVKWTAPIMRKNNIEYFPQVKIVYEDATKTLGRYIPSQNLIIIFINSHNRTVEKLFIESFASTVLHECYHHIQSKNDPNFKELTNYKRNPYKTNRIELECQAFEAKFYKKCVKDLIYKGVIEKT